MTGKRSTVKKKTRPTVKKRPQQPKTALPTDRFINRELSWLEFNQRVLDQAADASIPLLERAKFLAITSSNLDEFMMVRIGSLKLQYERNSMVRDPSGLTVAEQLQAVAPRCKEVVAKQYRVLRESLEPLLAEVDIRRIDLRQCSERCSEAADHRFHKDVFAVLSPQAIFEERPFPLLQGLGVHLCVRFKARAKSRRSTKRGRQCRESRVGIRDRSAGTNRASHAADAKRPRPRVRLAGGNGHSLHRRLFSRSRGCRVHRFSNHPKRRCGIAGGFRGGFDGWHGGGSGEPSSIARRASRSTAPVPAIR